MTAEINPRCTFDTFVEGSENQMACSAARAAAGALGARYNPLCIIGASGLGKTHLLMAVGHEVKAVQPDVSMIYCSAEEFAKEFHAAVAAGEGPSFRARYEALDLLLLDDAQALTFQPEIQDELLRLLDRLLQDGRQMMLSCDLPPSEFEALDEQLAQRLAGGLVVEVTLPDYETRLAILRRRAADRSTQFGEGILEEAARGEYRNVRELLAALHRLAALQAMQGTPLTLSEARLGVSSEAVRMGGTVAQAPARGVAVATPADANEFSTFLADVSHAVEEQVDHWREAVARAVMVWEPEGYRTARLEQALEGNLLGPVERIVARFEADVRRLRRLQHAVGEVAPERASDPVFYDPDRTAEAELLLKDVIAAVRPLPVPSDRWGEGSFIETDCSRSAVSAIATVAGEPGRRYNPLVLVGSPGVGKSHLLHVAAHRLINQGVAVACLSAHHFVDELTESLMRETEDRFRAWLGRAGALLLDDLQLIGQRAAAADELVYLIDRFLAGERQLVFALSGERHAIEGLDPRIVSRLEGGLTVAIDRPDRELRRQLTIAKLEEHYGAAELELVDYLAAQPAQSARSVIGLVQRILNAAEARGEPPSGGLARDLLEGVRPAASRRSVRVRTSGVAGPATAPTSREKTVWAWPDLLDRIVDEEAG